MPSGNEGFDFPCVNDYCPTKFSGEDREVATAWQNKKMGYSVFCIVCGEDHHFTQEEFRIRKKQMKKEASAKRKRIASENSGKVINLHDEDEYDEYEEYEDLVAKRYACQ